MWLGYTLLGLVLEGIALVNNVPNDTLTGTIVMWIPSAIVVTGVIGLSQWLVQHFTEASKHPGEHR